MKPSSDIMTSINKIRILSTTTKITHSSTKKNPVIVVLIMKNKDLSSLNNLSTIFQRSWKIQPSPPYNPHSNPNQLYWQSWRRPLLSSLFRIINQSPKRLRSKQSPNWRRRQQLRYEQHYSQRFLTVLFRISIPMFQSLIPKFTSVIQSTRPLILTFNMIIYGWTGLIGVSLYSRQVLWSVPAIEEFVPSIIYREKL